MTLTLTLTMIMTMRIIRIDYYNSEKKNRRNTRQIPLTDFTLGTFTWVNMREYMKTRRVRLYLEPKQSKVWRIEVVFVNS